MSSKVYQIITDQIIEALKGGIIPWRMPWKGGALGQPRNWNGVPYRGINIYLLGMSQFKWPFWFGLKKIHELGGRVKDSEFLKHKICVYYKILDSKKTDHGEIPLEKKKFILMYHKVWNLDQIDHIELSKPLKDIMNTETREEVKHEPISECEAIVRAYKDAPEIVFEEQRAYYHKTKDIVNMPKKESFGKPEEYYSTLFHELIHSTGSEKRLDREGIKKGRFGDEIYSTEELIAEFGATFLCGIAGIEQTTLVNSTAYIQNWIAKLKDKPQIAVQAAQSASRAADYLRGIKKESYEEVKQEAN